MLIKEYRIPLPLTLEEYRIAQLYMIQRKSREESEGEDSGVEIIENRPYDEGPFGSGQYTYKVYHIGRHIPSWVRSIVPPSLELHEEGWNAYPYTKTKFSVPLAAKFSLEIDTVFIADGGSQENVFKMSPSELRGREVDVLDIVNDTLMGSDYKKEEDPTLYQSQRTGRGLLDKDWMLHPPLNNLMCAYKLIKVEFRYWGLQSRVERFIHDGLRRVMLRAHRQAWAWQDEWVGLTIEDIRALERETQLILQRKLGHVTADNDDDDDDNDKWAGEGVGLEEESMDDVYSKPYPLSYTSSIRSHNHQLHSPAHPQRASVDEQSLLSYYALETIAIQDDDEYDDDSDEYFDARDEVSVNDSHSPGLALQPSPSLTEEPLLPVEPPLARDPSLTGEPPYLSRLPSSSDMLFLVVKGGSGLSREDHYSDQLDYTTLTTTMDEVMSTHYQYMTGRVSTHLVSCPDITSNTYDLLSSLMPGNSNYGNGSQALPSQSFPLSALPLLAVEHPLYRDSLQRLVHSANSAYYDFMDSDAGQNFSGDICFLSDSIGSIMLYDILSQLPSTCRVPSPKATPTKKHVKRNYSSSLCASGNHGNLGSTHSDDLVVDLGIAPQSLMFSVSSLFVFGSSLSLILSLRKARGEPIDPPQCTSFYNIFYSVDPLASRLEPFLDPSFTSIAPVIIPSYHRYPTGDNPSGVSLRATVAKHPHLFNSTHQLNTSSPHRPKAASFECLATNDSTGDSEPDLMPFSAWWGVNRVDYHLECPPALERRDLSNTAFAQVVYARYWETKELVSFVLRQVSNHASPGSIVPAIAGESVFKPFIPRTAAVKWAKRKTPLRIQKMAPNHRGCDVVVCNTTQDITLQAKFYYGPLDLATLSGEMVDIYVLLPKHNDSVMVTSVQCEREWHYHDTVSTDKHGKVCITSSCDQMVSSVGLYPVIFLVKGDHTTASCNLFVLPPHCEAVVFSVDGALSSGFSISGRDMKVKSGAVNLTRYWQELGYLIIYITGRPDIQKEYVTTWLGLNDFPFGVVSFADGLSTDSQQIKRLFLARLIRESKVTLFAAYGSSRHIPLYSDLGIQPNQIFIHSRKGDKRPSAQRTASGKRKEESCQFLTDGLDAHLSDLRAQPPRLSTVNMNEIFGKISFYSPVRSDASPDSTNIRKPRSASSSKSPCP